MNRHVDEERWLHDIDPPLSDRRLVVGMFVLVLLFVVAGVTVGLQLRTAVADRVTAVTVARVK